MKALFFQALEREPGERAAWLARACGPDADLRAEVEALLARYQTSDDFLERPPELPRLPGESPAAPQALPQRVGPYRILDRLGWGAMGVVYLAEQDHPRRRVALKVLRVDCLDGAVARRFEREAQALARLSHPGIAQVFEAGVAGTEAGAQPFLALELIEGGTLREHCQQRGLGLRERIALVAQVCDAIQHAHEQGVLHRDLKPDNVLIDARGDPKVVDFGVARLASDARDSLRTRTGQLLGTVAYMSPEQLRGAEVDARADQFALAAMLYELLTGRLPMESRGRTLAEAVRATDHEDPTPPSVHVRELRGDLETVLLAALDPDPARRYPDVAALAADLRRFLEGRPISARPPTRLYQLRKLVGRHRLLATSVGATILALTVGLGLALSGMREARAAERRVMSLSNLRRVEELRHAAERLHPFGPDLVEPLRDWLAEAAVLRADLAEHRAELADLRALEARGELSALDAGGVPGGSAWLLSAMASLVRDIEDLLGDGVETGLVPVMRARLALSEELEQRTLIEPAAAWRQTLAAIAQPDSPYRGLSIEPQLGLIPLGADPRSGLQEFLVYGTGTVPARAPGSGDLAIEPSTGLVLVLVPGGRFWMGAQAEDPDGINYDPHVKSHEGPPREVELAPFLIGKFEVTQGQWCRLMPTNPSYYKDGEDFDGYRFTARSPVDYVSRNLALDFLGRIACTLPTEAQWERAARAGSTAYVPAESLCGLENLACPERRGEFHLAVGSLAPNGFGLFDMIGNVREWCLDVYKAHLIDWQLPMQSGDALAISEPDGDWTLRGGSFARYGAHARVAQRSDSLESNVGADRGLRATRPLSGTRSRAGTEPVPAESGSQLVLGVR